MDIKSAYLNGSIAEDIFMHQPKGYKEKGSKTKVAKLKKGLYRLKQAGMPCFTLSCFKLASNACMLITPYLSTTEGNPSSLFLST